MPFVVLFVAGPVAWQLPLVVASALAYAWSYPPHAQRWLAWCALVPLLLVLRAVSTTARAALVAATWTILMAYAVNDWFPRAVSGYFGQPTGVGITLFLGVATFTAAIQYAAFAVAYRWIASLATVAAPLLTAAAWVTADLGRLILFGGDPWALPGYSQVGVLPVMQIADLAGVHGISFLVVAVNAAVVDVVAAAGTRRSREARAGAGVVVVVVAAALAYGAFRLSMRATDAGPTATVGIVQAHLPLGAQWRRELYGRNLETYLELSREVLRSQRPRLLVWPESAMTFFVADEPTYRASIAAVLRPFGAQLVAGGPSVVGDDPPRYRNSAFLIAPDGEVVSRYDKRILLPFAEYFPFRQVDLLRREFERVREFVPGEGPRVLDTAIGPAGVIICNEGFFPEPASDRVDAGARVLLHLANDSWLADPKFSEPAFDMVTLRAVEQRRWIVRASTAGPSALVDPWGRVVARTSLLESAVVAGEVAPRAGRTPYGRAGDAFAWTCAATTVMACVVAWGRRRRISSRAISATGP